MILWAIALFFFLLFSDGKWAIGFLMSFAVVYWKRDNANLKDRFAYARDTVQFMEHHVQCSFITILFVASDAHGK